MSKRRGLLFSVALLLFFSVIVVGFYLTGGKGLLNLYHNYLSQDLPEKKYSWVNFRDQGEGEYINGYYAGSLGTHVWIWTFSGLIRYTHKQGTSVYYYLDVCETIRQLAEEDGKSQALEPHPIFRLDEWTKLAKRRDYVSVKWIKEEKNRIIDKMQASSNQHYPIEKLRVEQCQN